MTALLQRFRRYRWGAAATAVVLIAAAALLVRRHPDPAAAARPRTADRTAAHWLASWGAAPQGPAAGNLSLRGFDNETLRQIVFVSAGGSEIRVRLTNAFGGRALHVGRAVVAIPGSGAALAPGTSRPITFAGQPSVLIPPGADVVSDPIHLPVRPLSRLAISLYLPGLTGPATEHYQARQTSYVAGGDQAAATAAARFTAQTSAWYFIDGVEVLAPARYRGAVATLGDSITDGVGSPVNANARWPNDLARRLTQHSGATLSVIDEGIGGNRVLNNSECCGVNAVARLDRDVLSQPGVRAVILLEGINDIGFSQSHKADNLPHADVSALQIVDGYEQIIAQAHAAGLKVYGATLLPFRGARYWTPAGEAKREAVNRWIRTSGAFDGVIDFAKVMADPRDPERLNPAYDSGDHLHPNAAGYRAMAAAVSLPMLLAGS